MIIDLLLLLAAFVLFLLAAWQHRQGASAKGNGSLALGLGSWVLVALLDAFQAFR